MSTIYDDLKIAKVFASNLLRLKVQYCLYKSTKNRSIENLLKENSSFNLTLNNVVIENDFVIFPFVLVFSSVFVLFAGLCIYFAFFCPSFIRELRIDRLDTIAGVEGKKKSSVLKTVFRRTHNDNIIYAHF